MVNSINSSRTDDGGTRIVVKLQARERRVRGATTGSVGAREAMYRGGDRRTATATPSKHKPFVHPALATRTRTPLSTPSRSYAERVKRFTPVFSAPTSPPEQSHVHGDGSSSEPDSERAVQELLESVRRARRKVIAHAARSGAPAEDDWVDMVLAATPKRQILFDGMSPAAATSGRHSDAIRHFHPALRVPSKRSPFEDGDGSEAEREEEAEEAVYDLYGWRELATQHAKTLRGEFDAVADAEVATEVARMASRRSRSSMRRGGSPPAERPTTSRSTVLTRTQRLAQREGRMGKIIKGFLSNALLSRMLAEWASFVRFTKRSRPILVKAAARLRRRQLKIGLLAWRAGIAAQREEIAIQSGAKVLVGRAVVPREILRGWNSWRSFVSLRRAEKNGVLRKILNRRLHAAFASWQARWAEKRRQKWLMWRTINTLQRRFICGAFAAWSHHCSETRRLTFAARRVIQRIRHQCLCAAMDRWSKHAKGLARQKLVVQRVVSRIKLRGYARAFERWTCFAQETARMHHVIQKVVLRLKRLQLSRVWGGWISSVAEGLRLRHAATCVVKALQHGVLSSAMAAWSDWAYSTKRAVGAAKVLAKTLANLPLYRAFNAWRSTALGGKLTVEYLDQKLDETVLLLRRMQAEKAFALWYGHTLSKRSYRNRVSKVVKHRAKLKQAHTCRVWWQWANRQRQVRCITRAAAGKLKGKTLGIALHAWVSYHRTMKRFTAILLRLWCNQKRAVFVAWCEHVRCGFLSSRMRKRVVGAFRRHWETTQLRWICEIWGCWATRRRALRRVVIKATRRMMHLSTARAYKAWQSSAHTKATARRAIRWMLQRTTERRCATSMREWRVWVVEQRRIRSSLARVARAQLTLVLRMWRGCVVTLQRSSRLWLRNCGRHTRWAFACWTACIQDEQLYNRDLSRDVLRFWRQHTVAALHERQAEAAASAQQALRLLMGRRVVSLFAYRWMKHRKCAAFNAWTGYAAHLHNNRIRLLKAKHKMAMCKRTAAINAWRAWVLEGGRLWNVSSRRERRAVRACLDAWRDKLHRLHIMRGVTIRWTAKSAHSLKSRSLHLWINCVGLTVTVRRMYRRCTLRLLRAVFHGFGAGCARARQYKIYVAIGLSRQSRSLKDAVLSSWVGHFRHARSVQHHERLWRGFRRVHLLHRIFRRWPMYLQVLRTRQKLEAAQAAHVDEVAATHRLYADKEKLAIDQLYAEVEAAHLAASRHLYRNTLRRVEKVRFKWAWKHWQQIWHLASVRREREREAEAHATTVSVQRTRAERDRMAYEQKLRTVAQEARRAEKWAHELQRAGCPLCDSTATVMGQTRLPADTRKSDSGSASRTWAGHRDDPGPKHHLHPARHPPDVPMHHLILLK